MPANLKIYFLFAGGEGTGAPGPRGGQARQAAGTQPSGQPQEVGSPQQVT